MGFKQYTLLMFYTKVLVGVKQKQFVQLCKKLKSAFNLAEVFLLFESTS